MTRRKWGWRRRSSSTTIAAGFKTNRKILESDWTIRCRAPGRPARKRTSILIMHTVSFWCVFRQWFIKRLLFYEIFLRGVQILAKLTSCHLAASSKLFWYKTWYVGPEKAVAKFRDETSRIMDIIYGNRATGTPAREKKNILVGHTVR